MTNQPKYDRIGFGYDYRRQADPYLASQLVRFLEPTAGKLYLDIGCGTGNYTHVLNQEGYQFIGIDPSERMLQVARDKNSQIDWRKGTAENTGLQDQCVDGIIASLTIHHWSDLAVSFKEMARVLKPNSRFVIFTTTPEQTAGYWLKHYWPEMLKDSVVVLPSFEEIQTALHTAGFKILETEKYFVQPDLQDHFLFCGKHDPEMYFDEKIRRGISSFADIANAREVEKGLAELKADMESGKVKEIMANHENNLGDYLHICAVKSD